MTEYQRQLKDPKWQKKRLEILDRDEWTCQTCKDTKSTLTVHHKSYKYDGGKFADIWDYDGGDLITMCVTCHEAEEAVLSSHQKNFYFLVRNHLESAEDFQPVVDVLRDAHVKLGRRVKQVDLSDISGIINGGVLWGK